MSKSLGEKHYINLFGDDNKLRKQIKSAVTDLGTEGSDEMSAGVQNLFFKLIIEPCSNISAQFQMLFLVFADRHIIRTINQDVRRLQNRVEEQARRDESLIVF